jgi:xanthine dehydrogenase molybdopterin-binding subunit B
VLGIMAARMTGRPVKLVLRREQMFGPVGHRPPTRQTLRVGADSDGRLTAIDHHTKTATSGPAANAPTRRVARICPSSGSTLTSAHGAVFHAAVKLALDHARIDDAVGRSLLPRRSNSVTPK